MRGDIPAVALKLLMALPVTTHERGERRRRYGPQNRGYIVRESEKRGTAGVSRPVRVGTRVFKSITEAKTKLCIAPATLYAMLDDGRASYV